MTEFIVTTIDGKQFRARSENARLSTVVDQLNSKGYPQPSGGFRSSCRE
ncbi:hypothetical protein [Mesorhizobium kowhaii]|nr:hypothetical protein [Mesorhizobium kowhaii]